MKHFLASFLVLALALISLTGCISTKLGGVVVNIVELKAAPPSAKGMQISAALNFDNENVIAIGVSEATHKLYLDGTYVGKAEVSEPVGLAPMKTAKQTITFQIEKADFVQSLASKESRKTVPYRIMSEFRTVAGEDKIEIKGSGQGVVDLSSLAGAK